MRSFQPIHAQIKDYLVSKIGSGEYGPGDRLPTENELTQTFQTSKSPVRQALESLRMEGIIFRHPGRGTFVSPSLNTEGWTLGSIEDVIGLGAQTKFQLREFKYDQASKELDLIFNAKRGKFTGIQGVRLLKGEPLYCLNVYLPQDIGKKLRVQDIEDTPVIVALEKKLKIVLKKCVQNISATLADAKLEKLLGIPHKSPVLSIERIYYTDHDEVVEWARSYCRPDLFKYRSVLSRR